MKLIVIHDIDCGINISLFSWDRPQNGGGESLYPSQIVFHFPLNFSIYLHEFLLSLFPKEKHQSGGGVPGPPLLPPSSGGWPDHSPPPPALPIEPWVAGQRGPRGQRGQKGAKKGGNSLSPPSHPPAGSLSGARAAPSAPTGAKSVKFCFSEDDVNYHEVSAGKYPVPSSWALPLPTKPPP